MMKPNYTVDKIDTTFFCSDVIEKGTILALSSTERLLIKYQHKTKPYAVSLCDVVNKDLTRHCLNAYAGEVQMGGLIQTVRRGKIIIRIPEGIKIGQTIYADPSTAGFSGKGGQFRKKVGLALSNSDEDGFVQIDFDLTRI